MSEWIEELRHGAPPSPAWAGRANVTRDVATHFLHKTDGSLSEPELEALEALCRKIHIARRVWTAYDPPWKNPLERTPLPLEAWPVLIGALLHMAERRREVEPDGVGEALKYVNAAFAAMDLYREQGGGRFDDVLSARAEQILTSTTER